MKTVMRTDMWWIMHDKFVYAFKSESAWANFSSKINLPLITSEINPLVSNRQLGRMLSDKLIAKISSLGIL